MMTDSGGHAVPRAGSPAALLLRDFVNTLDVECASDALDTPERLAEWLAAHELAPPRTRADQDDLDTARTLREGLRAAMLAHHTASSASYVSAVSAVSAATGAAGPSRELERTLGRLPLRLTLTGGRPALVPLNAATGAGTGLARLATAVMESAADGSWPRLKVCLESTCQWAFLDTSKNRSRSWCSMRVCGNRTKTRTYRARHRTGGL